MQLGEALRDIPTFGNILSSAAKIGTDFFNIYSRHLHKINVTTYNHQVRIN